MTKDEFEQAMRGEDEAQATSALRRFWRIWTRMDAMKKMVIRDRFRRGWARCGLPDEHVFVDA